MVFDSQSGTWRPSVWLAVERYQNYLYMNVTLDSGSTQILYVPPAEIYPDTPVRMGALDIDDTVLAPFSWSLTGEPVYSLGTVKGIQDQLTYQVQSSMNMYTTVVRVTVFFSAVGNGLSFMHVSGNS